MKNRRLSIASLLCFLFLLTASSRATVTINFNMGEMYASTNISTNYFPLGGLINLLAITNGTWGNTQSLIAEFSALTSSFVPTNAVLLGQATNDNSGGSGVTGGQFVFTYSGSLAPGEEMLAVCYPGLTTNSLAPGVGATGFFFTTNAAIDGSDIAWLTPSDGANVGLYALTSDQEGGTLATNLFTAGMGAAGGDGFTTAVPEPSALMLLLPGLAITLFVLRRGKRSVA